MPILHIDGWGHYATAETPRKWHTWRGSSVTIENTNPRRTGDYYVKLTNGSAYGYIVKSFPSVPNTLVVGVALRCVDYSGDDHRGFSLRRLGNNQASVVINGDGSVSIKRGAYNGTNLGTSDAGVIPNNAWCYLQFKIYVHDSAGEYEVRVGPDSVLTSASAGEDTKALSTADVDTISFNGDGTAGNVIYLDDLYIADGGSFLGDCRVDTLKPSGAGNYAQWTPVPSGTDNYANVDDANDMDDDTTYNVTDVGNEIDSFAFEDLSAIGGTIHAVALNIGGKKDDAGDRQVTPLCRMSSTDYTGTEGPLYDGWGVLQEIWENPPDAPKTITRALVKTAPCRGTTLEPQPMPISRCACAGLGWRTTPITWVRLSVAMRTARARSGMRSASTGPTIRCASSNSAAAGYRNWRS
jgi:hypothetical protein